MSKAARNRYSELKGSLEERRVGILVEIQAKMRSTRTEAAGKSQGVLDMIESCQADVQDDIEFALIQMKGETLRKVEQALAKLDEGTYGYCQECDYEISQRRLRALPFVVRCKDCEEARELAEQHARRQYTLWN
jgi:DnaK suppressor protein